MALRFLAPALLLLAPAQAAVRQTLRAGGSEEGGASASASAGVALDAKVPLQHLRICNAYASELPLAIYHQPDGRASRGDPGVATGQQLSDPLPYRQCFDHDVALRGADTIDFRAGAASVGKFSPSSVPREPARLLLVVSRRNARFHSAAFQSHSFTNADAATQVAVIDAYHGPGASHVQIRERRAAQGNNKESLIEERSQDLNFNSVISLGPGHYNVSLVGKDGVQRQTQELDAGAGKEVVVARVGSGQGAFPEQLLLFSAAALPQPRFLAALAAAVLGALLGAA